MPNLKKSGFKEVKAPPIEPKKPILSLTEKIFVIGFAVLLFFVGAVLVRIEQLNNRLDLQEMNLLPGSSGFTIDEQGNAVLVSKDGQNLRTLLNDYFIPEITFTLESGEQTKERVALVDLLLNISNRLKQVEAGLTTLQSGLESALEPSE